MKKKIRNLLKNITVRIMNVTIVFFGINVYLIIQIIVYSIMK